MLGHLVEAVLTLSQAASVCETDPVASAALAEVREIEMVTGLEQAHAMME